MKLFAHPVHTMLVHFPIAFWTLGSICDGIALLGYTDAWRASAVLIGLGVSIAALAMIPGLIDLARLPDTAQKTGLFHMVYMAAAWLFYLLALVLHIDKGSISTTPDLVAVTPGVMGFACLAIGGFYGGELVYRHGAGNIMKKTLS